MNSLTSWFTSSTDVPLPLATRLLRGASSVSGWNLSFGVMERIMALVRAMLCSISSGDRSCPCMS